jgi:putative membrane protein
MMWGGWDVSPTVWIVEFVLLLLAAGGGAAAVLVVARRPGTWTNGPDGDRPRSILDERLAAGEIDLDEYQRLRTALQDGQRHAP